MNSESNLNCYGKEFKCVNQTHFRFCSQNGEEDGGLTTIDGVIESCRHGRKCSDKSPTHCGTISLGKRRYQLKSSIRLIKGNRASDWRPKFSMQTEKQRKHVAEFRNRLMKRRQEQELFIDTVLGNRNFYTQKQPHIYGKPAATRNYNGENAIHF